MKLTRPLQFIILFALLQLVVALCSHGLSLTYDESIWHYIGRNWFRHGLTPYTGGVDNKSPLIFAVFGLSDALFGVNYWFPRILGILCQSAGLFFVYKMATLLAGRQTGIIALIIYGLSVLWHVTGGKFVSYTETYAITGICAAFYYVLSAQYPKHFFISGCCAGAAFCFRLPACFGIMAIVISLWRHNKKGTGVFLLGACTSVVIIATALMLSGISLYDFYFYGFADNFGAGSTTDHNLLWRLNEATTKFFQSELVLFYPFLVAYCLFKKRIDVMLTWLILEFIGINLIGVYSPAHFKVLLPALSITSAMAVTTLLTAYRIPVKPVLLVIWIVFFPKLLEPLFSIKKMFIPHAVGPEQDCLALRNPDDYSKKQLGWYIRSITTLQQQVLIDCYGAKIQVYTERLSPSIYFNTTTTYLAKKRFMNDVLLNKPEKVVIPAYPEYQKFEPRDYLTFINDLLAKDYEFERCYYGYRIYTLKRQPAN